MKYFLAILVYSCAFAKAYSQQITAQTEAIDFQKVSAIIDLKPFDNVVGGTGTYTFKVLKDVDSVYLDAQHFKHFEVRFQEKITTDGDGTHIILKHPFKAGETHSMKIGWTVQPKKAFYKVKRGDHYQLWTQGQGKYTSNWMPSLDDMNDKMEFDLTFNAPSEYTVIANGNLKAKTDKGNFNAWEFDMKNPMSSYLVAVVVGKYDKKTEKSTSGVPLEYYYYPEDSLKVEATYRYSKQMFDFLEEEIGVPYPWQNYKQAPVKDFLYAGMENTSTTVFSDSFMTDDIGFIDRNYVNVNAHELAHQWFGNLVTETKSDHHWLHEGFATYYALLAERAIFGDDYFYFKLFESADQLMQLSDAGKGQQLVAAGGNSLTYYQKGAWALHILREKVGAVAFAKAVKAYLEKNKYTNVTTDDFLDEVIRASAQDLTDFKKNWLYQGAFQAADALESLKKSTFMQGYFQLQALRKEPLERKIEPLEHALNSGNDYYGQEAIYQLAEEPFKKVLPLYRDVMNSQSLLVRQTIAETANSSSLNETYKGFLKQILNDDSYASKELALYHLWIAELNSSYATRNKNQISYLERTKNQFGFSDGNIRCLWLGLALATPEYQKENKEDILDELIQYTAPDRPFQLREVAFNTLFQLQQYETESFGYLMEACTHNVWRFRESARALLQTLLEKDKNRQLLEKIKPTLTSQEQAYLKKVW